MLDSSQSLGCGGDPKAGDGGGGEDTMRLSFATQINGSFCREIVPPSWNFFGVAYILPKLSLRGKTYPHPHAEKCVYVRRSSIVVGQM